MKKKISRRGHKSAPTIVEPLIPSGAKPVEVTENYIRIRVKDPDLFIEESFRIVMISTAKGIKAVMGKLKEPPEGQAGSMVAQSYLFDKGRWTVAEAETWVKDHGKEAIAPESVPPAAGCKVLGTLDKPVSKSLAITDYKSEVKDGVLYIEGYANTKDVSDRYGDIPTVFPSLRGYVYELTEFRKNPVMLINHENKVENIAGSFISLVEDAVGLRFKAAFSKSDLPLVAHARTVYAEGHGKALSIAGRWFFENKDNPNHLTYADIFEISLVGVGADPNALGSVVNQPEPKFQVDLGPFVKALDELIKRVGDMNETAAVAVELKRLGALVGQALTKTGGA